MQKRVTSNRVSKTMGLEPSDCVGKFAYSATQAAPAFSSSFPHMFGPNSNYQCLIPCAIDQDVYFRTTRDSAPSCGYKKPAVIHSVFLPAMEGPDKKMSSSTGAASTVFLDHDMEHIRQTIHKYAFSGAPNTLEELERDGANLEIDVSYQYLRFFMDDDAKLADVRCPVRLRPDELEEDQGRAGRASAAVLAHRRSSAGVHRGRGRWLGRWQQPTREQP